MAVAEAQQFLDAANGEYERVHLAFEEQFWGTKMNLKEGTGEFTAEKLSQTKRKMEAFLEDEGKLKKTEELLQKCAASASDEQLRALTLLKRTFGCYQMPSEAKPLRAQATQMESELERKRNGDFKSGYICPDSGEFKQMTSTVALRTMLRTDADERKRKAAWQGLRTVGPFICDNGWLQIVQMRNRMAKKLGYADFYDYKVTQSEGFSKAKLFSILDGLEQETRPLLEKAIEEVKRLKGEDAFEPWNLSYKLSGDVAKAQDPYFPFEKAVLRYAQSYARLGIKYRGATLNLDLLDRPKKYSNGFCHWPQPAWKKARKDGGEPQWVPSRANFTSLAQPDAVGSGKTAITTLMHEAGHAAHFANVTQPSPLFSQERAPTSVAYAETQSMFLDSLVDDADWKAQYARDRDGKPMPFELVQQALEQTAPFEVFTLRAMIAVPYFEKALYELSEEDIVNREKVIALADEVEKRICGGLSARPLLSVPHIMSDESSCYYHGYVLAEMAVRQTRAYFLDKFGHLTDNSAIGPALTEKYWQCGNGEPFLGLVEAMTGAPLTSKAWVADLEEPLDQQIAKARAMYDAAVARESAPADVESLNMRLICSDGDTTLSDSQTDGGIAAAAAKFEAYVRKRFFEGGAGGKL
eukprot:CAMPEP_0176223456 /NCGR_PEP_ID=MMETSP0121_2-20121125/20752_1 /TAXON_ID=160619 /ORGANISM="Kryptoperidinium foliaceum, Strain CCMP 1326" /LENGTH=638 /DNA_ID=CAMNT_0017562687 /DNA_START=71 /DNA_END=1987 /DNA_ORIENTATION=-